MKKSDQDKIILWKAACTLRDSNDPIPLSKMLREAIKMIEAREKKIATLSKHFMSMGRHSDEAELLVLFQAHVENHDMCRNCDGLGKTLDFDTLEFSPPCVPCNGTGWFRKPSQ